MQLLRSYKGKTSGQKSTIICLTCLLRYLFLDLIFSSRVLKGRRYDDALESCLKYCDGDPNFCGLASPGQIYNFVHQKVPKKLKGKDVRINGIKVSTLCNISTYWALKSKNYIYILFRLVASGGYGQILLKKACLWI